MPSTGVTRKRESSAKERQGRSENSKKNGLATPRTARGKSDIKRRRPSERPRESAARRSLSPKTRNVKKGTRSGSKRLRQKKNLPARRTSRSESKPPTSSRTRWNNARRTRQLTWRK